MKSIDVVIPNYNYSRYLRDCVRSVLRQDVEQLRILIIDNASNDDSQTVARELAAADSRIELRLREKNLGPHSSFNEGIDWARSDYFLILCSDDFLVPGALKNAVAYMESHPDVHMTFGSSYFMGEGETFDDARPSRVSRWTAMQGRFFIESLCRAGRNHISGPTAVVRTSIQKQAGYYDINLTHTDDLEMWLRFGLLGSVASTDAIQAVARVHSSNQSATVGNLRQWSIEFEAAFNSFFSGAGASLSDADELLRLSRRALSDRAYWSAASQLCRGQQGWRALLLHAIRLRPAAAFLPPVGYLARRTDASTMIKTSLSVLTQRILKLAQI